MFELLFVVLAVAAGIAATLLVLALLGGAAKLLFHVVLVPFVLLGLLVKLVLGAIVAVLLLVVGVPLAIGCAVALLPFLLVGSVLWAGAALLTAL